MSIIVLFISEGNLDRELPANTKQIASLTVRSCFSTGVQLMLVEL